MAQPLVGPSQPEVRTVTVSVLDVSPLTPKVRAVLRKLGGLSPLEAAEFYGPARLPRSFSAATARELVAALERLGVAARAEESAQAWGSIAEERDPEVVQHPGVREHF